MIFCCIMFLYNHIISIFIHDFKYWFTRYIDPADCSERKFFVCSTRPSTGQIDDQCPIDHYNYKSHCLKPSPRTMTYDNAIVSLLNWFYIFPSAFNTSLIIQQHWNHCIPITMNYQVACARDGGIVLPIKDPGLLDFVQSWGPRSGKMVFYILLSYWLHIHFTDDICTVFIIFICLIVRNSIWIGLRKKHVNLTYVDDDEDPLLEVSSDDLSYTDGTKFDLENIESKLGAGLLRGPCFALAANEELSLRDYKCTRESGFICQWKGNPLNHLAF